MKMWHTTFEEKKDLWDFLQDNNETIFKIVDWCVPRGRLESTKIDAVETEYKMKEYILKRNQHYYNKDYKGSLVWYNKVTDLDRNNFDEWNKKGYAFIKIRKPKEAIECYTHYLEKHPENPVALNNIAYELVKIHKAEDALHFIEKSLEIDNDNAYALDTKGVILGELKRYDESIEYLEKAIKKDPKSYIRWNHKGEVYLKQEEYEKAIECFETSLNLKPHYIKAEKNKNYAQKNLKPSE